MAIIGRIEEAVSDPRFPKHTVNAAVVSMVVTSIFAGILLVRH
jgi:hypothetical protein